MANNVKKKDALASISQELSFSDNEAARMLYGDLNRNLQAIEKALGVTVKAQGTSLTITGDRETQLLKPSCALTAFSLLSGNR